MSSFAPIRSNFCSAFSLWVNWNSWLDGRFPRSPESPVGTALKSKVTGRNVPLGVKGPCSEFKCTFCFLVNEMKMELLPWESGRKRPRSSLQERWVKVPGESWCHLPLAQLHINGLLWMGGRQVLKVGRASSCHWVYSHYCFCETKGSLC